MAKAAKVSKPKPRPVGRPSGYDPAFNELARKYCLLGATDADLASFFGVSEVTVNAWKNAHPDFLKSLNEGKHEADAKVADRLFNRALGYTHEAVKIFMPAGAAEPVYAKYTEQYPPDTTAAIFWLKNRQKAAWRDKQDFEHTGKDGGPIETKEANALDAILSRIAGIASRIGDEKPPGKPH